MRCTISCDWHARACWVVGTPFQDGNHHGCGPGRGTLGYGSNGYKSAALLRSSSIRGHRGLPRCLSPRLLLTTHYAVMKEEEAARFLEESATFVERAQRAASEALTENGELGLR